MLIENKSLNLKEFKEFYKNIDWKKVPRKLTKEYEDYFYVGKYEDDNKIIEVKIRPSMIMALSESFKNKDQNGNDVTPTYKGKLYIFGTTIEVKIDECFLEKIKAEAKVPEKITIQQIKWDE